MGALEAVIFDCDGVLVKSMELNHRAYQQAFEPLGIRIPPAEVFVNEGRRSRELIDLLARAHGHRLDESQLDDLTRRHREAFGALGPMPLYPGVEDLLRTLHRRGLRLAIVSGNWRANVVAPFGGLSGLFDVVVSAEDVARTKPDPEPYRRALEELSVSPNRAIVIENAPLGIQAAKAAGIRVIAVTTTNPRKTLREADVVVDGVEEVLHALATMDGG